MGTTLTRGNQNFSVFSHRAGERTSSNVLDCAGRREVLFVHLICARLDVFLGHRVTGDCCSVALSPIKDGLQQQGEGCGGRLAHAPLDGADILRMKLCVFFSFCFSTVSRCDRKVVLDRQAAGLLARRFRCVSLAVFFL